MISQSEAREIACWYQSSGREGWRFAAFASGADLSNVSKSEFLSDIEREIQRETIVDEDNGTFVQDLKNLAAYITEVMPEDYDVVIARGDESNE